METDLDDYATDLLRHLGVELVENVHSRPDGSISRELHVYADRRQMNHVLGWVSRQHQDLQLFVFEGPRPPF